MADYWRQIFDYLSGSPWSEASSIMQIAQYNDAIHQHDDMDELDIIRLLNAISDEGPMDFRPAFFPLSNPVARRRRPGFYLGDGSLERSASFRSQSTSQTAPVGSSSNPSRRSRRQPQPNGNRRATLRGRVIRDGSPNRQSTSLPPAPRMPNAASAGPSPVSTACDAEASVSRTITRSPRRKNSKSQPHATQTSSCPKRATRRRTMDCASTSGEDKEEGCPLTPNKLSNQRRERQRKKVESAAQQALSAIECPICIAHFDEDKGRVPCTLSCGHSICMAHMKRLDCCPICRESFRGRRKPKKSVALGDASKAIVSLLNAVGQHVHEDEISENGV